MDSIISKLITALNKEKIDKATINNTIKKLRDYWLYLGRIDWDNVAYIDILKALTCAKFLKAKFNNEAKLSIMQKTLVYRDEDICIFKPTTFEESNVIGEPICCFAYSQGRWDEHYVGYEEAIYYVYDVMRDSTHDFVAITVRPNGKALVLDKEHKWWTARDSMKYIQELGEGASLIVTKDGKPLKTENNNQTNENKTMKQKQVIRLNENKLRQIVSEALNEYYRANDGGYVSDDGGYSMDGLDDARWEQEEAARVCREWEGFPEEIFKEYDLIHDGMTTPDEVIRNLAGEEWDEEPYCYDEGLSNLSINPKYRNYVKPFAQYLLTRRGLTKNDEEGSIKNVKQVYADSRDCVKQIMNKY